MFDRNNFIGLSGFVWWVGVVVKRDDPLGVGRCKVRIHGWHSDNKMVLPTDQLPWATPIFPINNSQSWSAPLVGDWIFGFFMDGENAQFPMCLGVIPGIKQDDNGQLTPSASTVN